ncbi:hypothetical protein HKD37_06G016751 [Glycine soja]
MQSYPARALDRRLQVDWARDASECPMVLMSLRADFGLAPQIQFQIQTHLLLEVASPLSLPSLFRCHSSSKKQRNSWMKKILGLQAPMELTSQCFNCHQDIWVGVRHEGTRVVTNRFVARRYDITNSKM